jgi:Putative beta barrel porin-7 (BBP7)
VNPIEGAASNAIPATPSAKMLIRFKAPIPETSGPRFWYEAEAGVYGFSRNLPTIASITPPATTGPTFVPTSPGFIGLFSMSTVTNPLVTGATPDFGAGGSYRMGYWLDPGRTMAIDGGLFYVQGYSKFALSPTSVTTNTLINTTPDVFVGLFNDTTATTGSGAILDQLYGADVNFRMKAPPIANLTNFDVLAGVRYVALDETLTASVASSFSRTFQPALGLPPPVDFSNSSSGTGQFGIWNKFIGPQVGFDADKHWGRYWVESENELAVGATFEQVSVSGSTVTSTTPTRTLVLAGIPLAVNGGAPVTGTGGAPAFGLFAQEDRSTARFAVVPSGTIKVGYDFIPDVLSLTLAYNYLYLSSVGRAADQINSPGGIAQSSFFAQGVTLGVKGKF